MTQVFKEYPHFFPGQWLDYRDFNRLVQHSESSLQGVFRYLFQNGGIIGGAFEEFRFEIEGPMGVRIFSGAALLPNGELCLLRTEHLIDFSRFLSLKREVTLFVCIRNKNQGQDYTVDPEDNLISGYRTTAILSEIEIGIDQLIENSVELFRIKIDSSTLSLSKTRPDQWTLPEVGQIDIHYRRRIESHSPVPSQTQSSFHWRSALMKLEEILFNFQRMYLIEDHAQAGIFVSLLHHEILNRPFQLSRAQFLLEEVAGRLCLYLDRFLREASGRLSSSDRETVLRILPNLEVLRKRQLFPTQFRIDELIQAIQLLESLIQTFDRGIDFLTRIRTAITELQDVGFEFLPKLTLAGYSFDQVDRVEPNSEDRISLVASDKQMRGISAKFLDGNTINQPGLILKDGEIEIKFNLRQVDRPLVLLFRHYIRRSGLELEFKWNGRLLHSEIFTGPKYSHLWVNRGIVLPTELLVIQENRLSIKLASQAPEFGFYGIAAYQPFLSGVAPGVGS